MNDLKNAVADLDRAVFAMPDEPSIRYERANVLNSLGDLDRALADFNELVKRSPLDTHFLRERGLTWIRKHQPEMALADFSEAIRLDPKDTQLRFERGLIYYHTREYAKALADFDEITRLAPDSPGSSDAYQMRARVRSNLIDPQFVSHALAVESARQACQVTAWKDADCLITLAEIHERFNDFVAATDAIDQAIALLKPGDPRMESCQSKREQFRTNVQNNVGFGKVFGGLP